MWKYGERYSFRSFSDTWVSGECLMYHWDIFICCCYRFSWSVVLIDVFSCLSFRVPQPINVQFNFLQSLLANVYGPWCGQDPYNMTPLSELLRSCESGAPGLVAVLGLDKPSDQLGNFESPYVQTRINLNHNVRSLLAVCRRLAEPCNYQQVFRYLYITSEFHKPVYFPLTSFLYILRLLMNHS